MTRYFITRCMCLLLVLCPSSACRLFSMNELADEQDMEDGAEMEVLADLDMPAADLPAEGQDTPPDLPPDLVADVPDLGLDATQDIPPAFDPRVEPMHVLFLGNSFTHQGPVPTLVHDLALEAGWPEPEVTYVAPSGKTLAYHRAHPESLEAVDRGGWHVVVLQDLSTRPTDNAGDPAAFKDDALWFFERIQSASPGARVMLYMTWARHPDHGIYPNTFTDADQMQDQLAFHYLDAAARFIPDNTQLPGAASLVEIAPVGEVWRHHLGSAGALRLHDSDDYHANRYGRWLNALTLYAMLYQRRTLGLSLPDVSASEQELLTRSVDAISQQDEQGGPDGKPFIIEPSTEIFQVGEVIQIDFGHPNSATHAPDWNNVFSTTTRLDSLFDQLGDPKTIQLVIAPRFSGDNDAGVLDNDVDLPSTATRDSIWSGVLGGTHEQALTKQGGVKLEELDPLGVYKVSLFASRQGEDSGFGRLGRYQIGEAFQDFDVTNNADTWIVFDRVSPSSNGHITLTVNVSPDGLSRYAYLGVMEVERLE